MNQHDAAPPQEDDMTLQIAVTKTGLKVLVGLGLGLVPSTTAAPPID